MIHAHERANKEGGKKKWIKLDIWNDCWSASMNSAWVPTIPIEITLSFLSNYWFSARSGASCILSIFSLIHSIAHSLTHSLACTNPHDCWLAPSLLRPSHSLARLPVRRFHVTSEKYMYTHNSTRNLCCTDASGMGWFSVNK